MTYDTSNPVSIGFGTKKSHYDELWDNADWLRQVMVKILTPWNATTLDSNVLFPGLVIRPKFTYSDTDTILIQPSVYQHTGTTNQLVYWNSALTFDFANLAATDWSYLYLDDSAIVTADTNVITASELIDATAEPAWSDAKHGWYNGLDRCIFAVYTTAGSAILEFFHDGDFVLFADQISDLTATDITTDWSDEITLTVPIFVRRVLVHFHYRYVNVDQNAYWRTEGQTGTNGHNIGRASAAGPYAEFSTEVICSSNLKIDVKDTAAATNELTELTKGWYFSNGM